MTRSETLDELWDRVIEITGTEDPRQRDEWFHESVELGRPKPKLTTGVHLAAARKVRCFLHGESRTKSPKS